MEQIDTERSRIARLTDKQRQCMHLVVLRKSSKEIARQLGISKPTVDQRIAGARLILGAGNRDEAAIIFARNSEIYDRVIYDPAQVHLASVIDDISGRVSGQEAGLILEEPAIPFSGISEHQPGFLSGPWWSPSEDISTTTRLLIIVGLTGGILSVVLIGLAVAQSLSGLFAAR